MSKVIKSSSVQIAATKVLEVEDVVPAPAGKDFSGFSRFLPGAAPEDASHGSDADPGMDTDARRESEQDYEQDIARVKKQADEILRETEQMVRDLLQTARTEAEKIIESANVEAARIIAEGREKLRHEEDEARERGYRAGVEDGKKAAEEQYREKLREADDLVAAAHRERKEIIAGAEDEIVRLALAIARKIIGEELKTNPDVIIDIVRRAVHRASDREELTVRVHPDSYDTAVNSRDDISQSVKGVRRLKVVADPAVAPGGCVVESPNGTVDARLERQLDEIEQALMEVGPNVET